MDSPSRDPRPSDSPTAHALRLLTSALNEPDVDLERMFGAMIARFVEAVDSLIAVKMTLTLDGHPFTVTSPILGDGTVGSTVAVPLGSSDTTTCVLLLAASSPHAFATLAHDAASELGVAAGIEHDRHHHLFVSSGTDTVSGLASRSTIDQAIGILLERGIFGTVQEAGAALAADASRTGVPLVDVAQAVIDDCVT